MGTFIIAEAGVNHNGDIKLAKDLCYAAKEAGADAVKFQTWITENLITRNVKRAAYQMENTGIRDSQFNMLKSLELSFDAFQEIKQYCDKIKIMFMSTADDIESLDFLVNIGVAVLKIGSGEIGNIPYLRYIGSKGLPVILSTGMSSLGAIDTSLVTLQEGGSREITLLHCTTSYPCSIENVNLKAMDTLAHAFKFPVGYSDHTVGNDVAIAAVARGAKIIEKHFTLNKNLEGPDHIASTEPIEFKNLVQSIRNIEIALGNGKKQPTEIEKEISEVVLKKIVAKKAIKAGEILNEKNIATKRSNAGVPASVWDYIVGRPAKRDYSLDEGIDLW